MKDWYIFVNSKSNDFFKNNTFYDFTSILPESIDISHGDWEIGLCEIICFQKNEKCPNMFICSDMIKPSFCCGRNLPVLRLIPEMKGNLIRHLTLSFI